MPRLLTPTRIALCAAFATAMLANAHESSWPEVDARWACASRMGDSVQWHWGWTREEALAAAERRAQFYRNVVVDPGDCHSERHQTALDILRQSEQERGTLALGSCFLAPDCALTNEELGRLRSECAANPSMQPEVCFQVGR